MAGAPLGNTNAANAKKWQAAIERAISSYPDKPNDDGCSDLIKGLNAAAYKFVTDMMTADNGLGHFKEFGDRLDGKSAQSVQLAGDPDNPLQFVNRIEREVVDANSKD